MSPGDGSRVANRDIDRVTFEGSFVARGVTNWPPVGRAFRSGVTNMRGGDVPNGFHGRAAPGRSAGLLRERESIADKNTARRFPHQVRLTFQRLAIFSSSDLMALAI